MGVFIAGVKGAEGGENTQTHKDKENNQRKRQIHTLRELPSAADLIRLAVFPAKLDGTEDGGHE